MPRGHRLGLRWGCVQCLALTLAVPAQASPADEPVPAVVHVGHIAPLAPTPPLKRPSVVAVRPINLSHIAPLLGPRPQAQPARVLEPPQARADIEPAPTEAPEAVSIEPPSDDPRASDVPDAQAPAEATAATPEPVPEPVAPVLQLRAHPEPVPASAPEIEAEPEQRADLNPRAVAVASVQADPADEPAAAPPIEPPEEAPDAGPLDLFIFEAFVGPSQLLLALGKTDLATDAQALPDDPGYVDLSASDLVDTVEGTGVVAGGSAGVRLAMFSLGTRVSYSDYADAEVLTLLGEAAVRMGSRPIEATIGLGLGAGWLYGVPAALIEADSGLAMRLGLGLNYRFHDHLAVGVGADAVGLFLAGDGISPGQLGGLSSESDHPLGAQFPIHATMLFLL